MASMLSLSNRQLQIVTDVARGVPIEKRSQYLQRVAAILELRGRFSDSDVVDVSSLARVGLAHKQTDAA